MDPPISLEGVGNCELLHLAVHPDVCSACAWDFKRLPVCSPWSVLSSCIYSTRRHLNPGHCCQWLLALYCWCIESLVAFAGTATGWVAYTTGIILSCFWRPEVEAGVAYELVSGKASSLALQAAASCCVLLWTSLCCPHRKRQRAQCLSSPYSDSCA